VNRGSCSGYFWLSSPGAFLRQVVSAVPELVLGRVVAITSFDSGPLKLTDDEIAAGWSCHDGVAISPPVADVSAVPADQYDEWYIFADRVPLIPKLEVFVNYGSFSLAPPSASRLLQDPTWDKVALQESERVVSEMQARFWAQLTALNPLGFVAEGDYLNLATRSEVERDRAWFALGGDGSPTRSAG
jgi:hypothetical protein